jgi:type IV pilus assembly protein PilW
MSMAQFFMQTQRQSTGVGSATANALSALQAVKYESAQAGLGFSIGGVLPCTTLNLSIGNTVVSDGGAFLPVTASTTGVASTLTLAYGTALEAASAGFTRNDQTSADEAVELVSYLPASVGQAVMVAPPVGVSAPCTVRTVTGVVAPSGAVGYQLQFAASGVHNQKEFSAVTDYADTSQLFLLGQLRKTVFTLDANNDLVMSRPLEAGSPRVAIAHDIVAFLVQYGMTDGTTQTLQGWQAATGAWATPTSLQVSRVHALRVGVVARSAQRQKPNPDGTCDATPGAPELMGQTLALTGDWQCYKYRSLSAIVPLRNMVLGGAS